MKTPVLMVHVGFKTRISLQFSLDFLGAAFCLSLHLLGSSLCFALHLLHGAFCLALNLLCLTLDLAFEFFGFSSDLALSQILCRLLDLVSSRSYQKEERLVKCC